MKTVLEARELTKTFAVGQNTFYALKGMDVTVEEGAFVGVMGPSGAGKTTLLNVLATIDEPTSGSVVIGGRELTKMKEGELAAFRREKLGFLFQDYNLLDTLTLKENIILPLALAKADPDEIKRRVHAVADKLGIGTILDKYPYQVSGGQKQRTAAARAIITVPSLVLADEPTGALDSKSAKDLLESLQNLNQQDGTTILMVTHDAMAASYCSRVLFIKDGTLFKEIARGETSQKDFFQAILATLAKLED
jgi:putative ABC transport system ATP-binding protein